MKKVSLQQAREAGEGSLAKSDKRKKMSQRIPNICPSLFLWHQLSVLFFLLPTHPHWKEISQSPIHLLHSLRRSGSLGIVLHSTIHQVQTWLLRPINLRQIYDPYLSNPSANTHTLKHKSMKKNWKEIGTIYVYTKMKI